jgi:hypothetical protein
MGENFAQRHQEVYKSGILRRAIFLFNNNKIASAKKKLMEGFKLAQLRREFDPNHKKNEARRKLQEKKRIKDFERRGEVCK